MVISKEERKIIKKIYNIMDNKFSEEILIIDIKNISSIGDYFVICTGKNVNQVKAISDGIIDFMDKKGIKLNHYEGYNSAEWILLDYNNIIIHVFDKERREFYNLERLWRDGNIVDINML